MSRSLLLILVIVFPIILVQEQSGYLLDIDPNIEYSLRDFVPNDIYRIKSIPSLVKIGLLDSGVSETYLNQNPSFILKNFTNDQNAYDIHGHGTFSLSVS